MAKITANGPKANKGELRQALNFLKELLPNKLVTAIKILFNPCCTITGTGVAVCTDYNVFTLTITLDGPLPSYPIPFGVLINTQGAALASGTYTAPNTITTTVTFTGTTPNVTQEVGVQLLYPTSNDDGGVGVYHNFLVSNVTFNGNPCD